MELNLAILVLALLADRFVGDPDWLWRRIPHPVVLFGWAIDQAERYGNGASAPATERSRNGLIATVFLLIVSAFAGGLLMLMLRSLGVVGLLIEIAIVAVFIAQKSLSDHVGRVVTGLQERGLAGGREAVSQIVGRDPQSLDEPGVCRAAIESLAENFSDGVVAPAFWYAVLGLPGLLAYKMLNTADSMIGHKNERYLHFGRASAKADDLANWLPARLSALLIAAAAFVKRGGRAAGHALDVALRDAGLHRSPNAGWPECAMAGALDLALAGNRTYGGTVVREPVLNGPGNAAAGAKDIAAAIGLFQASCSLLTVLAAVLFLLL
ncbi:adenosylcobinamide-phosphate synthase CbiB [Hoeflea prorocentri]|uniref:Cobalamin biosynthesis protein CobD n=1 Tax=Hoeflea prorocentri TaxID=1922333 RepID=A0A9X3ZH21_9HYPH|nr:adenosylcobinamide-phosphate synthase CbiB [Hoeflea prorocentri]MCY6381372.1 adenosylcobinamide-phosphate synthase CbiB [Hoeflea prorocentri]MDA5399172.1 adenosylcobinamide-phosphate synthase CbiB [Hoeflea prorocentri]